MGFGEEKETALRRADRSLKGEVDGQIASLVSFLNSCKDHFTTSSCSGRMGLLAPGRTKKEAAWLLKSHSPLETSQLKGALAGLPGGKLWFRMEPLIIHITCRNLGAAKLLLQCSQDSGLKRSGLVLPFSAVRVLIRGSGLLNAPIAEDGRMLVAEEYLKELLDEANAKLERNLRLLARFEAACRERLQ